MLSVRGVSQARILGWVAISFSKGSSRPGILPGSCALQAQATGEWMSYRGSPLYIHTFSKFLTKSRYSYSRDASVVALVSALIVCHLDCGDSVLPDFSPHPQQSCSRCTRMNLLKIHLIMSSPPEWSPAFSLCPEDPLNSVTNKRLYNLAPVYPSSLISCHTPTFILCTIAALSFCPFPSWPCPICYSYGPSPSSPCLQTKVVQHDFYS